MLWQHNLLPVDLSTPVASTYYSCESVAEGLRVDMRALLPVLHYMLRICCEFYLRLPLPVQELGREVALRWVLSCHSALFLLAVAAGIESVYFSDGSVQSQNPEICYRYIKVSYLK